MSTTRRPQWLRARRRPPSRCGQCGWRRDDGHAPACARRAAILTTAEQIKETRILLMAFLENQQRVFSVGAEQQVRAYADAVSNRAAELGLEPPVER